MNNKPNEKLDKIYGTIMWLTSVTIIIGLVCLFSFHSHVSGNKYNTSHDFSRGWYYEDGTEADLSALHFTKDSPDITISREVDCRLVNGRSLAFMSNNLIFDIYLGDEKIYDYHPHTVEITGKYYGKCFHVVHIPHFEGQKTLKIVYTDLLAASSWTQFTDMQLVYPDEVYKESVRVKLLAFLVSAVTLVFGVAMLLVGMFAGVKKNQTISLGAFALALSAWTNSQTGFVEIITDNSSFARLVEYLSLMILPIPCILYMAYMTSSEKSKLVLSVTAAGIADVLLQVIAVVFWGLDYHDTLFLTHLVIIYGVVVIVYTCFTAIKEGRLNKVQKAYLIPALFIVVSSGLVDLLIYYLHHSSDAAVVSRLGLLAFVIILSAYELRQIISENVSEKEMEVMRRIANTDALTGLLNRTAYNAFEEQITGRKKGKVAFIHFDVNFLKEVNDTYGHEEGDKHLKAAASIIKASFGEYGDTYRIGGDEYVAVIEGDNCEELYQKGLEAFKRLQGKYNVVERPRVRMEIAQGMSVCDLAKENFHATQRSADNKMYAEKERLKSKRRTK